MLAKPGPGMIDETGKNDITDYINDIAIENIWHELGGRVTHDEIRRAAAEVMDTAEFQNATVVTFLPILIHRRTREKLKTLMVNTISQADSHQK